MEMEAEITDSESTTTSLAEKILYTIILSTGDGREELQTVDTNLQFEGLNTTLHIETAAMINDHLAFFSGEGSQRNSLDTNAGQISRNYRKLHKIKLMNCKSDDAMNNRIT